MDGRSKKGRTRLFLSAVRRTLAGTSCKSNAVLDVDDHRVNYYNNNMSTQSGTTEDFDASAAASTKVEGDWRVEENVATREEIAAIKIQAHFRGHLARRACGALRSIVKVQAAVRGMCTRRESRMAMHCMQALVRLQVRVRARQLFGASSAKDDLQ